MKFSKASLKKALLAVLFAFTAFGSHAFAQTVTANGKVIDANGEPLIGVGVLVTGTTAGTVTDLDGNFSIPVASGATLEFSSIGYATQSVVVTNSNPMTITLAEDNEALEEAVVVGYGTQKKGLVTGSVVTVNSDEIQKQATTNVLSSLYSTTPGVNITRTSGMSWGTPKITIRGLNTTGDSSPLYVIDGIAGGSIEHLNSSDIESISILKDAASAAIYGARAAAGVIFVTTRQGKKDKVTVTFDSYYGIQRPNMNGVSTVGAKEYIDLVDRAMLDEGAIQPGEHYYDYPNVMPVQWAQIQNGTWDGTNWVKEMINQNAPMYGTSVGITGGSDLIRFSMGYSNSYSESSFGYPKGKYFYKRNTFRINSDVSLWKSNSGRDIITFGENLVISQYFNHNYSTELRSLMQYDPLLPAYDTDGSLYTYEDQIRDGWYQEENISNPLEANTHTQYQGSNYSVQANAFLTIAPTKDWTFKTQLGYRVNTGASRQYTPTYQLAGNNFNEYDDVNQAMSLSQNWTWENTLQYNHNFGQHHFDALIGQSIEGTNWGTNLSTTRQQTLFGTWESATIDNCDSDINSTMVTVRGGNQLPYNNLFSLFGRLNWNYKETYMATAILRADGSSNFARGHRYGYFPSFSAGWVISNMDFMDFSKGWLDFLKLRASWGRNGNSRIRAFQYLGTVAFVTGYDFTYDQSTTSTGAYPDIIPNTELTWEATEQTDIGFDANLFDYRMNFTFDLYRKDTKDWLVDAPALKSYGTGAPTINGGAVRNEGFEIAIGWNDRVGDFRYNASVSLSHNRNKVLYINNADGIIHGGYNVISNNVNVYNAFEARPGKPIGYFTGIASEGIFQNQAQIDKYRDNGYTFMNGYENTQPGDVIWKEQVVDGVYDNNDVTEIGNPHPDYTVGFNIGFNWKGLDVSINGSGDFGQQNYLTYHEFGWKNTDNYANNFVKRLWTGEGSTNSFPRFSSGKHNNFYCKGYQGDIWVFDSDYLKVRNITIGYDLKSAIKKLPCEQLRIFFTGQNLITFTKYDGMDPEVGYGAGYSWTSGIDRGFYPNPKVFQAGISIRF